MSEVFLRSKKTLRPNSDDTASLAALSSKNSTPDCTCPVKKGKRKNSSSVQPGRRKRKRKRKRKRREDYEDVSSEEERKNTSSGTKTSESEQEDSKVRGPNSDDTAPLVAQRSHNSVESRGKRKNSRSGQSQRKRKRREEDDDESSEEDVSSQKKIQEISSGPEESQKDLEKKYVQLDCLGGGGFASVYAGYRRDDYLPVAIKRIPINTVNRTTVSLDGVKRTFPLELLLMQRAGEVKDDGTRSFSITLLDWYELQEELVLVMERPVPCKDLFDHIVDSGGHLKEDEAKVILRQLVEGVINIHSNGVLHRDIKPENILIQTTPEGPHVHILDFGCGSVAHDGPYTEYSGTPDYTPPEWHLQRPYQAVPYMVWQVGVVLFVMLCGRIPFISSRQVVSKEPYIPDRLSQHCKDLLRRCLVKQPEDRLTLDSILEHPWLTHT